MLEEIPTLEKTIDDLHMEQVGLISSRRYRETATARSIAHIERDIATHTAKLAELDELFTPETDAYLHKLLKQAETLHHKATEASKLYRYRDKYKLITELTTGVKLTTLDDYKWVAADLSAKRVTYDTVFCIIGPPGEVEDHIREMFASSDGLKQSAKDIVNKRKAVVLHREDVQKRLEAAKLSLEYYQFALSDEGLQRIDDIDNEVKGWTAKLDILKIFRRHKLTT